MTATIQETNELFAVHFGRALDGSALNQRQLVDIDRALANTASEAVKPPMPVSCVPSPAMVARTYAAARPGKALSCDRIGSELFHCAPQACAAIMGPVVLKSHWTLRPPLQWKGGKLFQLWKGAGSTADLPRYRDITCVDSASKPLCRPLRAACMPLLEQVTGIAQSGGGVHAGCTDAARLWLTAASDFAMQAHKSHAFVFVDVRSAFASIEGPGVPDAKGTGGFGCTLSRPWIQ